MKTNRLFVPATLLALVSLLSACGGARTSSTSAYQDAAPSFEALSMDLTASETTPDAFLVDAGTAANALADASAGEALAIRPIFDIPCHPHLFHRTHVVVRRVNHHMWRFLRHMAFVANRAPDSTSGDTKVWERTAEGVVARFTMTKLSDTAYTWLLELKKVDATEFTTVFSGQIDRAGAEGAHHGVGDMTLDLTALASVTGEGFQGVLTSQFDVSSSQRLVVFDAQGVVWDADENANNLSTPRNAHYVYFREPGKGGSLKIEEQMVFLCPANEYLAPADVKLVSRWYTSDTGSVHGRSDAVMTDGQLAAGHRIVGLTCHQGPADGALQEERAWLMKEEDASGATVVGGVLATEEGGPAGVCDPLLNPPDGTVPALDNNATDFVMSGIDFADTTPYPFPNM